MKCNQVLDVLSAFYDDELSPVLRDEVAGHLAGCLNCAAELRVYEGLSALSAGFPRASAPDVWHSIRRHLDTPDSASATVAVRWWRRRSRALACAALVLLAAGLGVLLWSLGKGDHDHGEAAFGVFLEEFQHDPDHAPRVLAATYHGRNVTLDEAVRSLPYRPLAAEGLPSGYSFRQAYLLDMPCCRCLQAILARDGGGVIAIFEHDEDQAMWFGDRPALTATCQGASTRLVQVNQTLAASWKVRSRYITIVGAADIGEVQRLVAHFTRVPRTPS